MGGNGVKIQEGEKKWCQEWEGRRRVAEKNKKGGSCGDSTKRRNLSETQARWTKTVKGRHGKRP